MRYIIALALLATACTDDEPQAAPYVCRATTLQEAEACAWELACPSDAARQCYEYVETADQLGQCVVDLCRDMCRLVSCADAAE